MRTLETVDQVVSFCQQMMDDCWLKMQREPHPSTPTYIYWAARRETLNFIIEQIEGTNDDD